MKKLFKYLGTVLCVALLGAFTACDILNPIEESADLGLGIKVFFPTKVVTGQLMTINGSGFRDVVEIEFPNGIRVTDFEIVSNDMIRVNAPAGIAAEGGKLTLRTADEQVQSPVALTLGETFVSGYNRQEGESIECGQQLAIYGKDLEFINRVEFVDKNGDPLFVDDELFYRKSTSSILITIPSNVLIDTFAGKLYTIDGKEIPMPAFKYEFASAGHWETQRKYIWQIDDPEAHESANWNGIYRYAGEGFETGEEIAIIPTDDWEKMKTTTFYAVVQGENPQIRVTTGWWDTTWTGQDIQPGNEHLTDNGDGTWTLEMNLSGDEALLGLLDAHHFLLTGGGFKVLALYFEEEVWIGGGHFEIQQQFIWEIDDPEAHESANWNGIYRYAGEGFETGEEIAIIPTDDWEKMKTTTFYAVVQGENPQIRVTTGWWDTTWTGQDIQPGNEHLTDNEDGTWTLEVNLSGDEALLALLDSHHLLFTGSGFKVLALYFEEEVWVGTGDPGPQEVVIWEIDDPEAHESANWNGIYRYAGEGFETGEEIAIIPTDDWEKMKTTTFYAVVQGENPQIRVTTGWWDTTWTGQDIQPGNEHLTDNEDGTWTLEMNLSGDEALLELLDSHHFLLTGSGFKVLKLYFIE